MDFFTEIPQSGQETRIEGGVGVASADKDGQITTDKALRFIVAATAHRDDGGSVITRPVSGLGAARQ
jgi:hypothetical protein